MRTGGGKGNNQANISLTIDNLNETLSGLRALQATLESIARIGGGGASVVAPTVAGGQTVAGHPNDSRVGGGSQWGGWGTPQFGQMPSMGLGNGFNTFVLNNVQSVIIHAQSVSINGGGAGGAGGGTGQGAGGGGATPPVPPGVGGGPPGPGMPGGGGGPAGGGGPSGGGGSNPTNPLSLLPYARQLLGPMAGPLATGYLIQAGLRLPFQMAESVQEQLRVSSQASQQISTGSYGFSQAYNQTAYMKGAGERLLLQTPLQYVPIISDIARYNLAANEAEAAQRTAKTTEGIASAYLPGGDERMPGNLEEVKRFQLARQGGIRGLEGYTESLRLAKSRIRDLRMKGGIFGSAFNYENFENRGDYFDFMGGMGSPIGGQIASDFYSMGLSNSPRVSTMAQFDRALGGSANIRDIRGFSLDPDTIARNQEMAMKMRNTVPWMKAVIDPILRNTQQLALSQAQANTAMIGASTAFVTGRGLSGYMSGMGEASGDIQQSLQALIDTQSRAQPGTVAYAERQGQILQLQGQQGQIKADVASTQFQQVGGAAVYRSQASSAATQMAMRSGGYFGGGAAGFGKTIAELNIAARAAGRSAAMTSVELDREMFLAQQKNLELQAQDTKIQGISAKYGEMSSAFAIPAAQAQQGMVRAQLFGSGSELKSSLDEFIRNQKAQIEIEKLQLGERRRQNLISPEEYRRGMAGIIQSETNLMQSEEMGTREAFQKNLATQSGAAAAATTRASRETIYGGSVSEGAQKAFSKSIEAKREGIKSLEAERDRATSPDYRAKLDAAIEQAKSDLLNTEMDKATWQPSIRRQREMSDVSLELTALSSTFTTRGSIRGALGKQLELTKKNLAEQDAILANTQPGTPAYERALMRRNEIAGQGVAVQAQMERDFMERLTSQVVNAGSNYSLVASQYTKMEASRGIKTRFFGGSQSDIEDYAMRGSRLIGSYEGSINQEEGFRDTGMMAAARGEKPRATKYSNPWLAPISISDAIHRPPNEYDVRGGSIHRPPNEYDIRGGGTHHAVELKITQVDTQGNISGKTRETVNALSNTVGLISALGGVIGSSGTRQR